MKKKEKKPSKEGTKQQNRKKIFFKIMNVSVKGRKPLVIGFIMALIGGGGFSYYDFVLKYIENNEIKKNVGIYRDIGDEYFEMGDFKKANEVYDLALKAKSYDSKTYIKYAENLVYHSMINKDNLETAKEMCKFFLRKRIDIAKFHHLLGAIYISQNEMDKAAAELEKAEIEFEEEINKKFDMAKFYFTWGFLYSKQREVDNSIGKYEKSISLFLDVIKEIEVGTLNLDKDFVKKCLGQTYRNLGRVLERHKTRYEEAIKQYRNAEKILLEIGSKKRLVDLSDVYNKWGVSIYMNIRKKDVGMNAKTKEEIINEALEFFCKSVEFNKENPSAFYNIACMYSILNKYDRSIEMIHKAISKGLQNIQDLSMDTRPSGDFYSFEENRFNIMRAYKDTLLKLSKEENFKRAQIFNEMGIFCMLTQSFREQAFNYFANALEIYESLGISIKAEETSKNLNILMLLVE